MLALCAMAIVLICWVCISFFFYLALLSAAARRQPQIDEPVAANEIGHLTVPDSALHDPRAVAA